MKNLTIYTISALLLALIGFAGCKTNEVVADCGCDAPNEETQFVDGLEGSISFTRWSIVSTTSTGNSNKSESIFDHPYNFWIRVVPDDFPSLNWEVCNENSLPQEILKMKETWGELNIRFSGYSKVMCDSVPLTPYDSFYNIYITKIEVIP